MKHDEDALRRRVRALRDRQLALTRELIAIPTVNPYAGDDSAGIETAGQAWVADQLRRLGGAVRQVAVPADVYERGGMLGPADRSWRGRDNIVAEWQLGDGRGPTVLLNDHMDTVGTAGMTIAPFDPQVRNGRLFGRGSTDTKGNLVMGLIAVQAVLAETRGLSGRIIFESVVDEECNGAGAGTLACCLAGVTGDVALCLDGSAGRIINGCNGIATARIIVRGKAGHSSMGGSISAVDKAIVVKQALDRFIDEHRRAYPHCHCNLGVFRAGTLAAIVPGEAEMHVNFSYDLADAADAEARGAGWNGSGFRARFETALAGLAAEDAWFASHPAEVSWIKDMYPFHCEIDNPLIRTTLAAAAAVRGTEPDVRIMPAWFDAAHLSRQLRIPVLGMGMGTLGAAHAADESVLLEDLYVGAEVVATALGRLLTSNG